MQAYVLGKKLQHAPAHSSAPCTSALAPHPPLPYPMRITHARPLNPEAAAKAWAKPKVRRHPRETSRGNVPERERFPGPGLLIESNCKSLANSF